MSSKIVVIAGGTDGMGKALAELYLGRGDEVVVLGRNPAKSPAGAVFVRADLSLITETRRAVTEIRGRYPRVDALVLAARHFKSSRTVTAEGFEYTFTHFYLARYLLSHGLAHARVIVNVAGPGAGPGGIRWDDLGMVDGYDGQAALMQSGRLNDLLGVGFAQAHPEGRYVLLNPGTVDTSWAGDYDEGTAALVEAMRSRAQPVTEAIKPVVELVDNPPAEPLSAVALGKPLAVDGPAFDPDAARRLQAETERLLATAVFAVSPEKLRQLLDSPVYATVATVQPDGRPHQTVVWVTRDGDDVLFMMAAGSRKDRNLRRDPRVNVLVYPAEAPTTYAAISGTARISSDGAMELADTLSHKYIGMSWAEHQRQTPAGGRDGSEQMRVVRVTPEKVVGRLS